MNTFQTSNPIIVGSQIQAVIALTLSPGISYNLPRNKDGSYPDEIADYLQNNSHEIAEVICNELGISPDARQY